uniref:Uncharacterized protein n=1 Tax=Chromera velia CCMP2878 TaxID=1169474 RepID=A0A0G4I0K6_9ALVE|eukprot:Cvel_9955.t1-p1 / transcript=Cvel_9955.t1 / gene=Cvel_9955 / organism=Chromera_velia_CCMP2878 / gene_product=hypothetical protein / transcript_product=hypothetical protein / location=Cvel_scaffold589:49508-56771(-) / protein_length=672 / sequence_SO=supercontig / SO=protein_coding / is_pseudo=false
MSEGGQCSDSFLSRLNEGANRILNQPAKPMQPSRVYPDGDISVLNTTPVAEPQKENLRPGEDARETGHKPRTPAYPKLDSSPPKPSSYLISPARSITGGISRGRDSLQGRVQENNQISGDSTGHPVRSPGTKSRQQVFAATPEFCGGTPEGDEFYSPMEEAESPPKNSEFATGMAGVDPTGAGGGGGFTFQTAMGGDGSAGVGGRAAGGRGGKSRSRTGVQGGAREFGGRGKGSSSEDLVGVAAGEERGKETRGGVCRSLIPRLTSVSAAGGGGGSGGGGGAVERKGPPGGKRQVRLRGAPSRDKEDGRGGNRTPIRRSKRIAEKQQGKAGPGHERGEFLVECGAACEGDLTGKKREKEQTEKQGSLRKDKEGKAFLSALPSEETTPVMTGRVRAVFCEEETGGREEEEEEAVSSRLVFHDAEEEKEQHQNQVGRGEISFRTGTRETRTPGHGLSDRNQQSPVVKVVTPTPRAARPAVVGRGAGGAIGDGMLFVLEETDGIYTVATFDPRHPLAKRDGIKKAVTPNPASRRWHYSQHCPSPAMIPSPFPGDRLNTRNPYTPRPMDRRREGNALDEHPAAAESSSSSSSAQNRTPVFGGQPTDRGIPPRTPPFAQGSVTPTGTLLDTSTGRRMAIPEEDMAERRRLMDACGGWFVPSHLLDPSNPAHGKWRIP